MHPAFTAAVLGYAGIYSLWLQKGYQLISAVKSQTLVSVRGVAWTSEPSASSPAMTVYDAPDIVHLEPDGFFVATTRLQLQQTRGKCAGNYDGSAAWRQKPAPPSEVCNSTVLPGTLPQCIKGHASSSGIQTGSCIVPPGQHSGFCEVSGWCPPLPPPFATAQQPGAVPLRGVEQMRASVKMLVNFPDFFDVTSSAGTGQASPAARPAPLRRPAVPEARGGKGLGGRGTVVATAA